MLNKIRGEQADILFQQRNVAANICYELGEGVLVVEMHNGRILAIQCNSSWRGT